MPRPTISSSTTIIFGAIFSLVMGYLFLGPLGEDLFLSYSGLSDDMGFIGFYPGFLLGVALFFYGGYQHAIRVGFKGVPTLFGQRLPFFLLSEGKHWLIPIVMNTRDVDVRTTTNLPLPLEALSQDKLPMRTSLFYKWQTTDPFLALNVKDVLQALDDIGHSILRDVFSEHTGDQLVQSSVKSRISAEIETFMKSEASKFGIDLFEAKVPSIRLPEKIEAANVDKIVQRDEAVANKIELDAVIARLKELKAEGMSAQAAAGFLLSERGKAPTTRTLFEAEGAIEAATILANALKQVFGKGAIQ